MVLQKQCKYFQYVDEASYLTTMGGEYEFYSFFAVCVHAFLINLNYIDVMSA